MEIKQTMMLDNILRSLLFLNTKFMTSFFPCSSSDWLTADWLVSLRLIPSSVCFHYYYNLLYGYFLYLCFLCMFVFQSELWIHFLFSSLSFLLLVESAQSLEIGNPSSFIFALLWVNLLPFWRTFFFFCDIFRIIFFFWIFIVGQGWWWF